MEKFYKYEIQNALFLLFDEGIYFT